MNFQPKTEQEIADSKLLPKGEYDFEILDAAEKKSAANNEMIVLELQVSNGNGISRKLTDYLLPKRPEKLLHCCIVCDIREKYERGVISHDDFPGKTGRLRLGVEKGKQGYPDKNVVQDYLTA